MNQMLALILLIAGWTQPQTLTTNTALPDTPAGRLVAAYREAFSAGESRMRDFLEGL
ncbi:MAG: hypothetical protein ACE15E_01460 [Acidobacteriota bacterium]